LDIKAWNSALFEHLRVDATPGRRVYLYVDREVLADLNGAKAEDAVTSFCTAFREAAGREPFERAWRDAVAWRVSGWSGEPPMVAALSMTVLAVTEDPLGAAHGVYRRQNQLLGLAPEAGAPPGYDVHVPSMWEIWNEWLEGPGRWLGAPSAHARGRLTNQGWARSQGLVRLADRVVIEDYLGRLRPGQLDGLSRDQRAREFRSWLAYRNGDRVEKLRAMFDDVDAREILLEVLEDEELQWSSGRRRDRRGSVQTITGLLFFDPWENWLDLAVEVDQRLTERPVDLGAGKPEEVRIDEPVRILTTGLSPGQLLSATCTWPLREGLTLRTTPGPAYVFREDPDLGGRIEVRGSAAASRYDVLVQDAHLATVAREVGVPVETAHEGPDVGWHWLLGVGVSDATTALRELGLGVLARQQVSAIRLQGGLRLASERYLQGGEPDLLAPPGHLLEIDGELLEADGIAIRLADRGLPLGEHSVTDGETGDSLRFSSTPPVRHRAQGSDAGWVLSAQSEFAAAGVMGTPAAPMLSGALLEGAVDAVPTLVAEVRDTHTVLVVDDDGGVFELTAPRRERWLGRAGLETRNLDVRRAVRGMQTRKEMRGATEVSLPDVRPAFVVTVSSRGQVTAIEIPPSLPLLDGVTQYRPRPDLVSSLLVSWKWIGDPADKRRSDVLNRALFSRTALRQEAPGRVQNQVVQAAAPTRRADLVDGQLPGNPYDVVLRWLSEVEGLRVKAARFAETWAWACDHAGYNELTGAWRPALENLRALGHIERDFVGQWVLAAKPALVAMPRADGLHLLTGARPTRVLQRLDDEDDKNDAVANAVMNYEFHQRTQVDSSSGYPLGPTVVYVAAQPGSLDVIRQGLVDLGISMPSAKPADTIVSVLPTLRAIRESGLRMEFSPARRMSVWRRGALGGYDWQDVTSDLAPGLYRYRTSYNVTRFAWRGAVGEKLLHLSDLSTGKWLEESRAGRRDHVKFAEGKSLLFVPTELGLPHLMLRALVLRTGLLPGRRHLLCSKRSKEHYVFENVGRVAAETVTNHLEQVLTDVYEGESA
jgi:hypothetical protein